MTHGHESENVMRMWFEWMNEHKDKKLVRGDDSRNRSPSSSFELDFGFEVDSLGDFGLDFGLDFESDFLRDFGLHFESQIFLKRILSEILHLRLWLGDSEPH